MRLRVQTLHCPLLQTEVEAAKYNKIEIASNFIWNFIFFITEKKILNFWDKICRKCRTQMLIHLIINHKEKLEYSVL